jgi:hypothetical protein
VRHLCISYVHEAVVVNAATPVSRISVYPTIANFRPVEVRARRVQNAAAVDAGCVARHVAAVDRQKRIVYMNATTVLGRVAGHPAVCDESN